ncbi:MAG: carbohydrate ABC transporter permease [Clostridiales bacterium]|nr:carbohydrate ABC transporter permease [Clostridiales bacterium]
MNRAEAPKIKKESKNKIRVEFDRTPLVQRLKAKFLNLYTLKKVLLYLFRLMLLIGVSYIILFPFFSKISSSFMSESDFVDVTVRLIPKTPTLTTYKAIITENSYFKAFANTFVLSLVCGLLQTFICCLIGYGFAKFKFKGSNVLFMLVIFTMVVPHTTLQLSMFMHFKDFDVLGIMGLLNKIGLTAKPGFQLLNTNWPLWILSATGLAYKNGLFIFLMRQFFRGIPDELEESAYLDGAGVFRTFFSIIIPISVTMMITVFMFSFCWQWTDTFYTNAFYTRQGTLLLSKIVQVPQSLSDMSAASKTLYTAAVNNTCGLLIILPLIVLYLFGQKYIVQGIERSGITG